VEIADCQLLALNGQTDRTEYCRLLG